MIRGYAINYKYEINKKMFIIIIYEILTIKCITPLLYVKKT